MGEAIGQVEDSGRDERMEGGRYTTSIYRQQSREGMVMENNTWQQVRFTKLKKAVEYSRDN